MRARWRIYIYIYILLLGTAEAPHDIVSAQRLLQNYGTPKCHIGDMITWPQCNTRSAQGSSLIAPQLTCPSHNAFITELRCTKPPCTQGAMVPPPPCMDTGPGPGGPGPLRAQYLWGNSEQLASILNAFYVEHASCRLVSETATTLHTVQLQGRPRFAKWHSGIMKIVRGLVGSKLLGKHTQDIAAVC